VATGSRSGDGSITLAGQNGATIYGSVTVAYTADDADAGNTLTVGLDNSFALLGIDGFDFIGVVAQAGIADGELVPVIVEGKARVLIEAVDAVSRGSLLVAGNSTAGRAHAIASPPPPPTTDEHFREIGHALQACPAGANNLIIALLHKN
jgi:hypothetical protein